MIKQGYKQTLQYINEMPTNIPKLSQVTDLLECRYNPDLPKTDNVEEFMKRPLRYAFRMITKATDVSAPLQYYCIFDKKDIAQQNHKKCMEKLINDLIEPYQKKNAKGIKLTERELEYCKNVQARLKED